MAARKKTASKKSSKKKSSLSGASTTRGASARSAGSTSAASSKRQAAANNKNGELPAIIYAQASVHSIGGVSMFDAGMAINASNVGNFMAEQNLLSGAVTQLQQAGFTVLQVSGSMINIAGAPSVFENAFGTPLESHRKKVIKPFNGSAFSDFLDSPNSEMPGLIDTRGGAFGNVLEGVAIEEPRYYMSPKPVAASPMPPNVGYWHLSVPSGVAMGCNAGAAHRAGITGRGVVVSMVDSGFYRHPFFSANGYRADDTLLGPGASNPADDESGHGTGESANIFALAPDVRLRPIKMNFVNSIGSFDLAVSLKPDIITCSWGSDVRNGPLSAADVALANSIATAVASGITVVFSAGNGHWGFPGQHPDVISAGGVFMDRDGSLKASDYASGFMSNVYPGRRVPDVSGLVGMQPGARYIMLPVQPGDSIDKDGSGGTHPNGDETAKDDGWATFSGTSAAAPQLAGAAALVKQACPHMDPAGIRDILAQTATDVSEGQSHENTGPSLAHPGPDAATGHGLVNAHRATMLGRIRRRSQPPAFVPANYQPAQTNLPMPPIQASWPTSPAPIVASGVASIPAVNPPALARLGQGSPAAMESQLAYEQGYAQAMADWQTQHTLAAADTSDPGFEEADLDELETMVREGMIDPEDV